MHQHIARIHDGRGINGDVSFVDVTNDAFLINQEGCAISKTLLLVEDSIVPHDCTLEIAEQRKGDADLLRKLAVGGNAIHTHSKNLCVS